MDLRKIINRGFFLAVIIYLVFVISPNLPFALSILDQDTGILYSLLIIGKLFLRSAVDFSNAEAITSLLLSLLIGANISLLIAMWKRNKTNRLRFGIATGVAGTLTTLLGIGCAACGTALFSFLAGGAGFTFFLSTTFSDNSYVQLIGVALLCASSFYLYWELRKPLVC